jgi:hypothetical protein
MPAEPIFTRPARASDDHRVMPAPRVISGSLLAPLLDRELLAGTDPARDPALARRGERVCARRRRDRLAAALERVVAAAEHRADGALTAAAPVAREEVLANRTAIRDLACRLRSDAAVDPQGVLLVRRLLADPASPLNVGAGGGALLAALRRVSAALRPRQASNR